VVGEIMSFEPGTVVVFDENTFNPEYWDNLSEEDRIKYYGPLGYGQKRPKLFVFMCSIFGQDKELGRIDTGHCVLIALSDQKIETMRHTDNFRVANEEEF
jgi:hypothetical protein